MYVRLSEKTKTALSLNTSSWPTMCATKKGYAQAQVVYSFGRRDQLDVDAIKRLVKSLCRFVSPQDALQLRHGQGDDLLLIKSRPAGGAYLLRALWDRLNISDCLQKALKTDISLLPCNRPCLPWWPTGPWRLF